MNGIHDMGGRDGFGPVRSSDDALFHVDWERRAWAMVLIASARGCFNVDAFRHAIERLKPEAYLADGYYGRWLGALELLLRENGGRLEPGRAEVGPARREVAAAPRFAVGDRVRTRNHQPAGHTRLPAYARARAGTVAIVHPAWVLPDSNAHDRGEAPEYVYAVRFASEELFGARGEAGTFVHLDCFESYLEAA